MAKAYTRSSAGKYETALMEFIPKDSKEWTSLHVEMIATATTIDNLTADIIRDSKAMAARFEAYAIDLDPRRLETRWPRGGWSPMGYSSLRDIDLNIAQLAVHKETLRTMLRMIDAHKAFVKALTA
jgi:hypothetical protein